MNVIRANTILSHACNLHQRQYQRARKRQSNHSPTSLLDLLIGDHRRRIPDQMPDTIKAVKCEWQRNGVFGQKLEHDRPASKRSCHGLRLDMPSKQRCNKICCAKDIEAARKNTACQSVQTGQVPCYLRLVDCEMGGNGAV